MESLKALLAVVALPVWRVEQKLPDAVETRTLLDYAFKFVVLLLSLGMGYTIALLQAIDKRDDEIDRRLTRIEASRFTAQQGNDVWIELNQKLDKDKAPPPLYREYVSSLEDRIQRLEGR